MEWVVRILTQPDDFAIYLEDEWLIEPSNEEVQNLAIEMSNGTDGNVIMILKNIFDYIESNYKYQKSSVPKSCPDTIVGKVGDCDDFSILFSSIARAAGIPAWLELGIIPAFIDASDGCGPRNNFFGTIRIKCFNLIPNFRVLSNTPFKIPLD